MTYSRGFILLEVIIALSLLLAVALWITPTVATFSNALLSQTLSQLMINQANIDTFRLTGNPSTTLTITPLSMHLEKAVVTDFKELAVIRYVP